jgi:Zn-dependent protease
MSLILFFQLVVLIFSVMLHEIAHGAMALKLGDDTAQKMGRLTLNPLKHLDPFGSVFLPLILILLKSPFLIGWAKPVPYDPRNLRDPRMGSVLVALAGPVSNVLIAVVFGLFVRLGLFSEMFTLLFSVIIYINLLLAIFNLVPIPPLDGSKLLYYFIPDRFWEIKMWLEQYGFFILLLLIASGVLRWLSPVIGYLFYLITGQKV